MDVNELVWMVFSHLGRLVRLSGHIQHCAEENPLALRGLGLVTENTSIGRWNRSSEGVHHTHTHGEKQETAWSSVSCLLFCHDVSRHLFVLTGTEYKMGELKKTN